MTLPIANGLAGSAGHALPEDAVCDWKGPIKGPFAIGRDSRPTRECPYSRYENALSTFHKVLRNLDKLVRLTGVLLQWCICRKTFPECT
jgi:hypothetical protein